MAPSRYAHAPSQFGYWRPLIKIGLASAKTALKDRSVIFSRVSLYFVVLIIFSRLWRVAATTAFVQIDAASLIWYLIATEWIVLSVPAVHLEVEREIQGGELGTQLLRPTSYPLLILARAIGQALTLAFAIGTTGIILGFAYTGGPPVSAFGIAAIPIGVFAIVMLTVVSTMTGLTTVWLGESAPVYWIWQKLLFMFGGLIFPLSLYPGWLSTTAWLTPFAPLLSGPASLVFEGSWASLSLVIGTLLFWSLIILYGFSQLWTRVQTHLLNHGG